MGPRGLQMMSMTRARQLCLALFVIALPLCAARAAEPAWQPIHITGRVVDSNGKPIKGAMCIWDWTNPFQLSELQPAEELFRETVTDADGRFELTEHESAAADVQRQASGTLWFLADGHALHWQVYEELPPITSHRRNLEVVLKPAKPFSYHILDPDGHPRVGELVEPIRVLSKRWMTPPSRPIRDRLSGTTDEAGVFVVNYLAPDQGMMVRVMSERFGTLQQWPNLTRGMPPVVTLQLRRVGRVEGVIELDQPERFTGRRVHLNTNVNQQPVPKFGLFGTAETTLDAHGRFHVPTLPEGELSVYMDPVPGDELVVNPKRDKVEVKAGSVAKISVPLVKRIPITGRVRMADGGVPEGEATIIVPEAGISREYKGRMTGDGHFQISVDPGEFKLRVEFQTLDGMSVAYGNFFAQTVVTVSKNAGHLECPDLVLPKTRIVEGRALATDGQPLVGTRLYAQLSKESGVSIKTDAAGRFRYVVAEGTPPGEYILFLGEARTPVTLERTDDPLTVRIPSTPDNSAGH